MDVSTGMKALDLIGKAMTAVSAFEAVKTELDTLDSKVTAGSPITQDEISQLLANAKGLEIAIAPVAKELIALGTSQLQTATA